MRKTHALQILAVAALGFTSACGETALEQALMGGGAGAATSLLVDGDVTTGVVIGAAANVAYCQKYPTRC